MIDAKRTTRREALRHLSLVGSGLGLIAWHRGAFAQSDEGVLLLLNARNPTQSLSAGEVKKVFLGQTAFWHGVVPVRVLIRPDTSRPSKAFFEPVLGMTVQAYRKHWDELQLAGRGVAPATIGPVEDLAKSVAQTPGAIAFVLASEAWQLQNVKVLSIKP